MKSLNWNEHKYLYQIDKSVTKRQSSWICVCDDCQNERIITYCQAFNIIKGKSNQKCRACLIELGIFVIKTEHLSKYRKYNQRSNNKTSQEYLKYYNLFNNPSHNEKSKEKQRIAKLGKIQEKANNWQGGKVSERKTAMSRNEYKQLRKYVFERDEYTCQICHISGGKLEMDHIKEWCNYPELRYEISNCRTLCKSCHKTTDNYSYKAIKRIT